MRSRRLGQVAVGLAMIVLALSSGCCMPESLSCLCRMQTKPPLPPRPPEPPMPPPEPYYEHLSLVSQKLHTMEDERNVLLTRLQYAEGQLEDKEKALALATREIGATREQMARTRAEMLRWKEEMAALRTRLKGVEDENQTTLESVIKFLEKMLQEEKAPPPRPEPGGPELSPPP